MSRTVRGVWLGRRRYDAVHALQERLLALRQRRITGDTLLLVEHEPVVTLGRGARPEHLLESPEGLTRRGIELVRTGRGGDVTLHVPGQLVGYPILDLSPDRRDVRRYVRDLTEVMRRFASELGVATGFHADHVGLWADSSAPERYTGDPRGNLVKVGAIGVRISRWVTMHGFALNLKPDLSFYRCIVPCGVREHGVSSLAALGAPPVDLPSAARRCFEILADVFDARRERFADQSEAALDELFAEPARSDALQL